MDEKETHVAAAQFGPRRNLAPGTVNRLMGEGMAKELERFHLQAKISPVIPDWRLAEWVTIRISGEKLRKKQFINNKSNQYYRWPVTC